MNVFVIVIFADDNYGSEHEEAATKIQAGMRGYLDRKRLRGELIRGDHLIVIFDAEQHGHIPADRHQRQSRRSSKRNTTHKGRAQSCTFPFFNLECTVLADRSDDSNHTHSTRRSAAYSNDNTAGEFVFDSVLSLSPIL